MEPSKTRAHSHVMPERTAMEGERHHDHHDHAHHHDVEHASHVMPDGTVMNRPGFHGGRLV